MTFWENVLNELDFQCKPRKWLAAEVKIDVSTIGTGAHRGSIPQADVALRVARALNVSLEYLLTGMDSAEDSAEQSKINEEMQLFLKYRKTVANLERLTEDSAAAVVEMIAKLADDSQKSGN